MDILWTTADFSSSLRNVTVSALFINEWVVDENYGAAERLYTSKVIREREVTLLYHEGQFYLIPDRHSNGRQAFLAQGRTTAKRSFLCHRCLDTFTHDKDPEKCCFTKHLALMTCLPNGGDGRDQAG